jgi:hypothetical protein
VDIYRSAATEYESGDYLFFAGIYRHFRTSLQSPGCGKNNAGHAPNGFANDGMLDVRFLHGGRKVPAKTFEYVDTWDARAPWISLDINRCQVAGDIDTFGGSCDNNNPEELRKTTTGTGTLYMSPGYLLSANGEEIYIFGSAQAFTHGSDAASVLPAGSTQPWGNNTAIVRYILRRDGFTHIQGEYIFNVGYHSLPMVVTQPIRLQENCTRLTLKLNVVTSVVGYVLTELLDPTAVPPPAPPGQPPAWHQALLGFEAATSISIKGNFISRTVAWGDVPRQRYGFVCGSTTINGHCNATWEPGSRPSPWEPMTCAFASESMPNGCAGFSCSAHPGVCNKTTGLCEVPSVPDESLCMYRNVTTTADYRDSLHELEGREVQVRLIIPDAKIYSIAFECERPDFKRAWDSPSKSPLRHDSPTKSDDEETAAWVEDGSDSARPFDSLGFHRYRVQLSNNSAGTRVTIPWHRRSTPPLTSPIAIRDVSGLRLNFTEVGRSAGYLELVIEPQRINTTEPSYCTPPRYIPPFPWLTNIGTLANVGTRDNYVVDSSGGLPPEANAWKAADGIVLFGKQAKVCSQANGWDVSTRGGGQDPNREFLVLRMTRDGIAQNVTVDGFALFTAGDTVHDPLHMLLEAGQTATGPWRNASHFIGANASSGSKQGQVFDNFSTSAPFFRWTILDRYTPNQAFVAEVFLRAATFTPHGYLQNNRSMVVASSGDVLTGDGAEKITDGIDWFRGAGAADCPYVCQGWDSSTDVHGQSWAIIDLGRRIDLTGFGVISNGDVTHDPAHMLLSIGSSAAGPWTVTVANLTGSAGSQELQHFTFAAQTSRFWKWTILSTWGALGKGENACGPPCMSYIAEIFFKPMAMPAPSPLPPRQRMLPVPPVPPPPPPPPPLPLAEEALVYILPFVKGGPGMEGVTYSHKGPADERSGTDDGSSKDLTALPVAPPPVYEGRDQFTAFTDMELAATSDETAAVLAAAPSAKVLVWYSERTRTIRMRDAIPLRFALWPADAQIPHDNAVNRSPLDLGMAKRGEHYMFQLGMWAARGNIDSVTCQAGVLTSGGRHTILPTQVSSPALAGVDSDGLRFNRTITVAEGGVGVLWMAVSLQNTTAPGVYQGNLTLTATENMTEARTTIVVRLSVSDAEPVADGGDDEDISHLSRSRWLDSTAGQSNRPSSRFQNLLRRQLTVSATAADVTIGPTGLPSAITKAKKQTDLLAAAARFIAVGADGVEHQFNGSSATTWDPKPTPDCVRWQATSHAPALGLTMVTDGEIHGDASLQFKVDITNTAGTPVSVQDLKLVLPFRQDRVPYLMGLGKTGGLRPPQWEWRWTAPVGTLTGARGNHMVWAGSPALGMRLKLTGADRTWGSGMKNVMASDVPAGWGGKVLHSRVSKRFPGVTEQVHAGGVNVSTPVAGVVTVSAYGGARLLAPHEMLEFRFEILCTPARPFNPQEHFAQRYVQDGGGMPTDTAGIEAFVRAAIQNGVRTVNVHQSGDLNPFINYITDPALVAPLSEYARLIHEANGKLKLYYTTRELSNHVDIMWVLRSLGGEIIDETTTSDDTHASSAGWAWLQEHLGSGYESCWANLISAPSSGDAVPGVGGMDAAVCDGDIGRAQAHLRWENYYVRGLQWMVGRAPFIDGVYLDGVAYDRSTMKRARTVMDDIRDGCLIDMHSGNNFQEALGGNAYPPPDYGGCAVGCVSPALQYMQHMGYMDRTMLGELYNYDNSADYYLIEISSLAWGLGNDMLGKGNPHRGMVRLAPLLVFTLFVPRDHGRKRENCAGVRHGNALWKRWRQRFLRQKCDVASVGRVRDRGGRDDRLLGGGVCGERHGARRRQQLQRGAGDDVPAPWAAGVGRDWIVAAWHPDPALPLGDELGAARVPHQRLLGPADRWVSAGGDDPSERWFRSAPGAGGAATAARMRREDALAYSESDAIQQCLCVY